MAPFTFGIVVGVDDECGVGRFAGDIVDSSHHVRKQRHGQVADDDADR